MVHNLLQDIRFGIRALFKSKLFAIAAIVTLALGIGANTAVFSAVNAVLLAPLPFQNADELVVLWRTALATKTDRLPESVPNLEDLRAQNQAFVKIAAVRGQQVVLTDGDQPERIRSARASANLFSTLGVKPILGRDFLPDEDQQGASPVVIISYGLWQERYGADPNLIGRTMTIDRKPYTIVGVLPQGIYYPNPETNLYVPLIYQLAEINRGQSFLGVIGRLKPGVSFSQARAELDTIAARMAQQYPEVNTNVGFNPVLLRDQIVGPIRTPLIVLLAAAASVLLIACANIANLLLARASARRGEFAIRAALGATRIQIVRQMIIESVLLSSIGGTLGLLLALGGVPLLISISADNIPRAAEIGINLRVLGFTAFVSLFTAAVAGLAPALRFSSNETVGALREGRRGATGGVAHQRLLRTFVVSQLAIAVVLFVKRMEDISHVRLLTPDSDTEYDGSLSLRGKTVPAGVVLFRFEGPLFFAHRGGSALAPENTLVAYEKGLSYGADALELDVHPTRDGEIVVALVDGTDATLKRFYRDGVNIRLQPSNAAMKPIIVAAKSVQLQGRVIGVLRKY